MKPFVKPLLALALLAALLAAACAPAPTTVTQTVSAPGGATMTVTSPGGTTTVTVTGATATPIIPSTTPSLTTTAPPATGPTITIISPADGSNNASGDILVTVAVSGFNVAAATGQPNAPGAGLIAYYLDTPPPGPGASVTPPFGQYAAVAATNYTFHNVGFGMHFIFVQLVNNDGTPLNPPVVDAVYFRTQ